jgi:outer membrane protein assembly factor BamB
MLWSKWTKSGRSCNCVHAISDGILECVELESRHAALEEGPLQSRANTWSRKKDSRLAEEGKVSLVEASPETFVEMSSFQAIEGITWNNLSFYGKLLLVRNSQEAACYELP